MMSKVIAALVGVMLTMQVPVRPTATMGPHCLMGRPALLADQEPSAPAQGNPGHREPPPGWTCANGAHADHPCTCHRKCVDDDTEDPDGTQHHGTRVVEDAACLAYCFKDHCTCGVSNCE